MQVIETPVAGSGSADEVASFSRAENVDESDTP